MKDILKLILQRYLKLKFYYRHVDFLPKSRIDKNCTFQGYNSIGVSTILNNCSLGLGSYVGRNNELVSVKIGKYCSIGSFIINTTGAHPSSVFVSTHPAFFSKGKANGFTFVSHNKFVEFKYAKENYLVSIGNDVWIGDRVTILDGISIGDGAIIGAGSVVTKNIEPYTINVGTPTRVLKKRFTDDEIFELKKIEWWNKDWNWIKENCNEFANIKDFLKKQGIQNE